jgi:hypothetical protein
MASKEAVAATLAFFHELYPTRDVTDFTLDAWMIVLDDVSDAHLHYAARTLAKSGELHFFPSPGEVRKFVPGREDFISLPSFDPVAKWYAEKEAQSKRVRSPNTEE